MRLGCSLAFPQLLHVSFYLNLALWLRLGVVSYVWCWRLCDVGDRKAYFGLVSCTDSSHPFPCALNFSREMK
jgi:hypothetical protein